MVAIRRRLCSQREGVVDDPTAGRLEFRRRVHAGDADVERRQVLRVPLLDGGGAGRARRRSGSHNSVSHVDGRHEQALAVLVGAEAVVVGRHLADGGDLRRGRQHRQVIAGAGVAEVVFRPVFHGRLPPSQTGPPMHRGVMCPRTVNPGRKRSSPVPPGALRGTSFAHFTRTRPKGKRTRKRPASASSIGHRKHPPRQPMARGRKAIKAAKFSCRGTCMSDNERQASPAPSWRGF